MSDLYLIAHLVRSEPAFDIASQVETESETIWIIPTSGHRAWPYWSKAMNEIRIYSHEDEGGCAIHLWGDEPPKPPSSDWPDHYSIPTTKGPFLTNLAAALGFKREEVKRRV